MNTLVPVTETRIVKPETEGGFSASLRRKVLAKANPTWTKKQVREAVRTEIQEFQPWAVANMNEAIRRGYTIEKSVTSVSGRITQVLVPPRKTADRKIALSTLTLDQLEAEIARRRSVAVA